MLPPLLCFQYTKSHALQMTISDINGVQTQKGPTIAGPLTLT